MSAATSGARSGRPGVSVPGRGFVALIATVSGQHQWPDAIVLSVSVPGRGFVALIAEHSPLRRYRGRPNRRVSVPGRGFVALIVQRHDAGAARGLKVSVPGRGFVALIGGFLNMLGLYPQ